MIHLIVDTNVILVANGQHKSVSQSCVATCALKLQEIMKDKNLVLDDTYLVLKEYLAKTLPKTGNRPGDAFVKWALQNNSNRLRVELVTLKDHSIRMFEAFPADRELEDFDPADRKFVALSAAHPLSPTILQATDSKWLSWQEALIRHGVTVEFLCPHDIKRFRANKSGKGHSLSAARGLSSTRAGRTPTL